MKLLGGLVLAIVGLFALPAHADQIYDVTGSATITGNNVCNGVCVETINFNFSLDESLDTLGYYEISVLPGETGSVSGPLPFAFAEPNGGKLPWDRYSYVAWYAGPYGDRSEFDVYLGCSIYSDFPFVPCVPTLSEGAFLYSCSPGTCLTDFGNDTLPTVVGTVTDLQGSVPTPEPTSLALLALGLSVFIPLKLRKLLDSARGLAA